MLNATSVLAVLMLGACSGNTVENKAPVAQPAASLVSANDLVSRGKEHFAAGRFGLALSSFQQAKQAGGDTAEVLDALAAGYDRIGRFDLSGRYYRQALALAPQSPEILNNLGYSLLMQGQHADAAVYLRQAKAVSGDAKIAANLALAENGPQTEAASERQLSAVNPPVGPKMAQIAPRDAWVERTAPGVMSLVTRPGPAAQVASAQMGAPGIAHVSRGADAAEAPAAMAFQAAEVMMESIKAQPRDPVGIQPVAFGLGPHRVVKSMYANGIEISGNSFGAGIADRAGAFLRSRGYSNLQKLHEASFTPSVTTIYFAPGHLSAAQSLAQKLPRDVPIRFSPDLSTGVRLSIGADFLNIESRLPFDAVPFDEDVAG
jgi:tetratricopeptide (TPR) repeat protein